MTKKKKKGSKKSAESKITQKDFFSNEKRLILLIALFCLLLYGNTIRNEYSLDDVYVTNNEQVKKGFRAIPEILTSLYATNVYEDGQRVRFGYRPIVKTTFAIEYGFFGENPHVSHLINLILYFLLCLLVYHFLKKILQSFPAYIPFIITLLFIANPLHTEVVSSLKNRDELLSVLFGFLSLRQFIRFAEYKKWVRLLYGFLFFVLAYYSKMSAIVFIALIPLVIYFFTNVRFKNVLLVLGVLLIAFVAIRLFNRSFLPGSFRPKHFIENPLLFMSMTERLPAVFNILLFYLKKLILPVPLLFYYGYDTIEIVGWSHFNVIVSIIIHSFLVVLAISGVKKKRFYSFFILFYLIVVSMYSNLLKPPMGIVADRFLFLMILPFSIALVYLVDLIIKKNVKPKLYMRYLYGTFSLILFFHTIKTIDRNRDWYDQMTLVSNDIGHLEESARANFIYAGMLKADMYKKIEKTKQSPLQTDINDIKKHLNLAVTVYPDYHKAWDMLGKVYHILERNEEKAIECFEKAISIKGNYVTSYQNLAFLYVTTGKLEKAAQLLEKAYRIRPRNQTTLEDLVDVYAQLNKIDKVEYYSDKLEEEENRQEEKLLPRAKRMR